jgi:transcriptional regulator with XRE-family HTH domain
VKKRLHEKLFKLRKKAGLTQEELSEALNVSRQAISRWEMGTAMPDIENIISLSNQFNVSIDYLVNDSIEIELDTPIAKATAAFYKISYRYILMRVIIACCVVAVALSIGVVTHSLGSMLIVLLLIGTIFLIYYVLKLLFLYYSNKNKQCELCKKGGK